MLRRWSTSYVSDVLYASRLPTLTTRTLIRHAIFDHTGPPRRSIAWPRYGNIGGMCLAQEHNDTLPSSGSEPRVNNLAVAKFCSYPLRCTTACRNDSV